MEIVSVSPINATDYYENHQMNQFKSSLKQLIIATTLCTIAASANAETVLRLDEVPVGELDPAKASDYADSILMFNVYDTLVLPRQGKPGHVPHLATAWKGSGTSYTFDLRTDVRFHSGNKLTSEDVVFSLERMQALESGLSYLFANVKEAVVVDEDTVRFELEEPYAPFVAALVRLPIVDKKLIMQNLGDGDGEMKDWGAAFLSANDAGTGAYEVAQHNPQGETILVKNPEYFLGVSARAPDRVRLRYGLEASTVRTLLAQGEHDVASQWMPPEVAAALARDGFQLFQEGGTGGFYIKLNTQKPPLDDVNCRRALANAFDYEAAIKLIAITDEVSQGSVATGAIPVGMYGAKPLSNAAKRDMTKAKKFLADCKYNMDDYTIEVSWIAEVPLEERFALLMQANFSELGIKSKIEKLPWASFVEKISTPDNTPHISQLFVNAVTGDPDTLLYGMYHSSNAGTWQSPEYLNDAKVDELLEKGRIGATDEEREAAYAALNDRLLEIVPTIYVNDRNSIFVANPKIKAPALTSAVNAFGLDGLGFSFRLFEMPQ